MVRRLLDVRLPDELKGAFFAIVSASAIISVAWGIESYRLRMSLAIEAQYESTYARSRLQLAQTKVLFANVSRLAGLAQQVHAIQLSGDDEAKQLAEIGNRLPSHVWLTSLVDDGTAMSLSGRAADLGSLSRTVARLSRLSEGYSATLISATGDGPGHDVSTLRYELRVEGGTQ